jgi:hypothetical protein
MTEEQIKEQLSRHFVEVIANRRGFKCVAPNPDHRCDVYVSRALPILVNGAVQYEETGEMVHFQLKSTTERSVEHTPDGIKYDLDARAYNSLVIRRDKKGPPLYLVVLVLPDESNRWLSVGPDEISLRKTAYWYYPAAAEGIVPNTSTKRITLPHENSLSIDFMVERFSAHFP